MPIYLLPLDVPNGLFVDETTGGVLTLPGVPGFSLTIDAGSATFPDGSKSGIVSVTLVHVDKIPMVPNFGQQPRFVVTIQPDGVLFDPPAPITIPNVDGLVPGEVTEMYSFDHDLGQFVSIGTGTVSDDGLIIASDPGVGIIKGGWHCGGNPTSTGDAQPATVKITSQKPVNLGVDETAVITASGGPSPGSYSWTSSDPSTVEILPPTSGANVSSVTVKLKKVGSATITVRYTCESGAFAEDTVKVGTAVVEMTAHRPNSPPINVVAVPDNVEEFPGAGIRLNGDDDDGSGTQDRNDGLPIGEDDLIKLVLEVNPTSPDGIEYVLKRTDGSHLRVWTLDNKGPAVLDANDEKVLNFSSSKMTVWVEAISSGMSFLEFQARSTSDGSIISEDKVKFFTFTSIVIVLGGEGQVPSDPPPANFGTFDTGIRLYKIGYDVHMYDEDVVGTLLCGGAAQDEVESSVNHRGIRRVAIFGYSHGGGSTLDLVGCLNDNRTNINFGFNIIYTAYIDAIEQVAVGSEEDLPPGTGHHVNYYETNFFASRGLNGDAVPGANFNCNVNSDPCGVPWGTSLNHFDIDDQEQIKVGILNSLTSVVPR